MKQKAIYSGLTLIELLIAMVIVSIVIAALYTGLSTASRYIRHTANKTIALNFVQGLMEEIKNMEYEDLYANSANYHSGSYTNYLGPELNTIDLIENDDDTDDDNNVTLNEFDDVDDYNGYSDTVSLFQQTGVSITGTRDVLITDQDGDSSLDAAEYTNASYKIITVTLTWSWQGNSYTESLDTIVAQHN